MRQALVEQKTGLVVNIIELLADSTWTPPAGYYVIGAELGAIGDTWDGVQYTKPVVPFPVIDPDVTIIKNALPMWDSLTATQRAVITKSALQLIIKGK